MKKRFKLLSLLLSLFSFYSFASDEIEIQSSNVLVASPSAREATPPPTSAQEISPSQQLKLIDLFLEEFEDSLARRRILALDGGGVRGAFTAEILRSIERETGKPIHILFQGGITGTSTGSFIALGLTTPHKGVPTSQGPYTAEEIVTFYKTKAKRMFPGCCAFERDALKCPSTGCGKVGCIFKNALSCFGCFGCCHNCGGVCGPRYRRTSLDKELKTLLGDTKLEAALTPVQIATYDISSGGGVVHLSSANPRTNQYLMREAAAASSAAPTYFPAVSIGGADGTHARICVDGGLFENTPILAAISQAMRLSREELDIADLTIVSIGTGQAAGAFNDGSLQHAGALSWARPAIQIGMGGTSEATDIAFRNIDKSGNYIRIQCALSADLLEMDEPGNVEGLIKEADKLYSNTTSSLHNLFYRLKSEETFITNFRRLYEPLEDKGFKVVLEKFRALVGSTHAETLKNLGDLTSMDGDDFPIQVISNFKDVRLLKALKTLILRFSINIKT